MTDHNGTSPVNKDSYTDSRSIENHITHATSPLLKTHIPVQIEPSKTTPPAKINAKPAKKKRRDKSDLGENFIAPDGGWGWVVSIAAGLSTLVLFALAQNFGIIFRERMLNLGITNSELTTIINTQIAISAFTGLLNGPMFRRYSYRQVALVGSLFSFLGLFLSVFADSFVFYMCTFSFFYGFGRGVLASASSLAVNTYFKLKRRTATAYTFGVAGVGPIILPYFATYLLESFGVQGTVLIFAGILLNTIPCALVYQPVKWHVKKIVDPDVIDKMLEEVDDDDTEPPVEPETAVLARANDGWYGSRVSLNSTVIYKRRLSTISAQLRQREGSDGQITVELQRLNSKEWTRQRKISTSYSIKEVDFDKQDDCEPSEQKYDERSNRRTISRSYSIKEEEYNHADEIEEDTYNETDSLDEKTLAELQEIEDEKRSKLPFLQKVIIFFDLDLLRDFTYINLAVGLTLINFVEINFAILTPFILSDFGFNNSQIALAMSSLGFCDLVVRFLIPLITANMNFSNKTFFIVGIAGMCIGRALLAFTRDFYLMVGIFVWLGLNKAFRTVFWSLIIPSYVPLKRLPAAAGLQLLMSGLFSMAFGPLIGLVRDNSNFAVTLNVLNGLCIFAIVMWIVEAMIRKRRPRSNSLK